MRYTSPSKHKAIIRVREEDTVVSSNKGPLEFCQSNYSSSGGISLSKVSKVIRVMMHLVVVA